mmetsp:Transcript_57903/g.148950  ORF Transcript_57903/g.148950 Transcript_57903/m.148950 type:complete len:479 (+) Transcript_57903:2-1438(+)
MAPGRRRTRLEVCLLLTIIGVAAWLCQGRLAWVGGSRLTVGDSIHTEHAALQEAVVGKSDPQLNRQDTIGSPASATRPWQQFAGVAGAALALVALVFGTPNWAWAEGSSTAMAAVAPCLLSQCQVPLAKCVLNPNCAANLTCIIACSGSPDEKSCQIKCGDNFENDVVGEFNACALSAKKCVPQRPDEGPLPGESRWDPVKGRYPIPPAGAVVEEFDVSKFTGRWYITSGLNPLFDIFPCQVHFFEGFAPTEKEPGKLVGKINWRVAEPDGEFLTKSTVQRFVQTSPGVFENHDNEYLHYQDDWYILDHSDEDDPDLGFILIYYRGRNDAWAGYGGGTLYTRARTVPPAIMERVREATARAKVPFDKFWKFTDNQCEQTGDPVKLRAQFAEKLLRQGELSVEEQLTYMARTAYSEIGKDETYVVKSASRLEKMTQQFLQDEAKQLATVGSAVEREIEKNEIAYEAPVVSLLKALKLRT